MEIESKMFDEEFDILVRLDSKSMFDHLISAIFKNLDAKSISNSENVSSEWSNIIGRNDISIPWPMGQTLTCKICARNHSERDKSNLAKLF